jgi:Arc/MetJ family transcription regulator
MLEGDVMRTNIVIDDDLIEQAMKATGLPTKKAVVEAGLQMLIQVKAQSGVRRLRGKVKWQGNLDELRSGRAVGV